MDLHRPTRFRTRKFLPTKAERFLGVQPHAPPSFNNSSSLELDEDDVVFDFDYSHPSSSSSSSSSSPSIPTPISNHNRHHYNHHQFQRKSSPLGPPDSFGVLAVLPENEESPDSGDNSNLLNDALIPVSLSASSSSNSSPSSSSKPMLIVQRPSERTPSWSSPASDKFYHSAPMNVPMMSSAMANRARRYEEEDAHALNEEEEFRSTMPPHEYLSRQVDFSPMHSCSLFEGVGRTLKGRDMRQVRNAVLSQTGCSQYTRN
ncbi:nuclear transcription factor Y subunit gamma isoform X2 [Medicago truncatula]|uniref:nuclear transcription factor Y subunit gamma isoform X2 n=1 Tax=Medicago truncatula TaxID=3880 RepID=UPI000D2F405D|nr:nuclear transcription factor Y subunit gamma isoform X2 [Medicago truncatula]